MDPNDWLMGGGKTPGISWRNKPVGTTVTGVVCRESKMMQQRDPDDNELLWWDDAKTQPKMQLVMYIQTNERDPAIDEDDGVRALYIKGKSLTEGMREAVRKSGRKGIEVGGRVTVVYVGEGEQKNRVKNPPKLYRVEYVPPADTASTEFFAGGGAAGTTAPPPAAAPTSPAPAGPAGPPPGVDPAAWSTLDDTRRAEVLKMLAGAGAGNPPF